MCVWVCVVLSAQGALLRIIANGGQAAQKREVGPDGFGAVVLGPGTMNEVCDDTHTHTHTHTPHATVSSPCLAWGRACTCKRERVGTIPFSLSSVPSNEISLDVCD